MKDSIKGDLGAKRAEQARLAFRKPIKAAGRTGSCAKRFIERPPRIAGESNPKTGR